MVGRNLIPALIRAGYEIRILGHKNLKGLNDYNVPVVKGDVLAPDTLYEFVDGADVVLHLAAIISMTRKSKMAYEINVNGTSNLLEASRKLSVSKFIHFSSIHSYSPYPLDAELDETRSLNFTSKFEYDRSKAASEKMVLEANSPNFNTIILNPSGILGPGDNKPSPLGRAVVELYKGNVPALLNGGYNWVDLRDVVDGTLKAIRYAEPGQAYLLSGHWKSLDELAQEIAANGGKDPPRWHVPFWLARLGAHFLNVWVNVKNEDRIFTETSLDTLQHSPRYVTHQKATATFGYNPRPFSDTIRDLIIYYRKTGLI